MTESKDMAESKEIIIYGKKYNIRSDSFSVDPEKVADFVNSKMKELSGFRGSASTVDLAVLAALNIAHDFLTLQEEKGNTSQAAEKRVDRLIDKIGQELENIKS